MAEEATTNAIIDMLRESERERAAERCKQAKKRRAAVLLMEQDVLPVMPHSLVDCYRISQFGPSWGDVLSASIVFEPTVDMHSDAAAKKALGTIDKVAAALKRAGWAVVRPPEAHANEYQKNMRVELGARKGDGREAATLIMTFNGIQATDRCRLVEKDVIVAATPEHTEKRLVVECDDPAMEPRDGSS